jgi:hypothetical protein
MDNLNESTGQSSENVIMSEVNDTAHIKLWNPFDIHDLTSPSCCSMARTSSVISMPTGHQVILRPQPTQPLVPN